MIDDSIRELMDCCRPQGDDLNQPELQRVADLVARDPDAARQMERSRQLDVAIGDAVQKVSIPAGLEQRLLQAVAEASVASPAVAKCDQVDSADTARAPRADDGADSVALGQVTLASKPASSKSASRKWLWGALATSAAALILIALVMQLQTVDRIGHDELALLALSWEVGDEGWQADNRVWTSHPLPRAMPARRLNGRCKFVLPRFGDTAYCYDVTLQGGSARIFVFTQTARFDSLPTAPPATPMFTLGKSVAAWSDQGLVYVVVMDGGVDDYKRSIQAPLQVAKRLAMPANICLIHTI